MGQNIALLGWMLRKSFRLFLVSFFFFGHSMHHVGSSSLTRDWACACCSGSMVSKSVDCQGSPSSWFLDCSYASWPGFWMRITHPQGSSIWKLEQSLLKQTLPQQDTILYSNEYLTSILKVFVAIWEFTKIRQTSFWIDLPGYCSALVTLVASASPCSREALTPGGGGGNWLWKVEIILTSYYLCFFLFFPASSLISTKAFICYMESLSWKNLSFKEEKRKIKFNV